MAFITDKQTQTDLNLLGKYKTFSMLNLFNQVKTRGGERLLEAFFQEPLSNAVAINRRSACIQYLQELGFTAEMDREQTEMAALYLAEGRPSSRLSNLLNGYLEKFRELLFRSRKLDGQQKQIQAVQEVLQSAGNLLGQLQKKGKIYNPCQDMQEKLDSIVNHPSLKQLHARYPYTVWQTAHCRYLFQNKCRPLLQDLLRLLYEFDVYLSVASVAAAKGLVYAQATDHDQQVLIEVENLRHPALKQATGNSITLSKKENMLFLTGANMAGKSTWMKTLGISLYLAHMGFPVAADKMTFSVMEGIFTSINVPDDISLGWSHFYAEVMRVKRVATEVSSGKRLFILFDELFKGTNVKDAFDATLAVTQKLARYQACAFVISTHILEVGEALAGTSNIQFYYMPTVMEGAAPRYTYKLAAGITADRQGMIIIEKEGILDMLQ